MWPHKTWVCRHICQFQHMWPPAGAPGFFFFSLMHPIGPELPISAHLACARVCRQLYVLCASHALVQATVGVGTVIIVYIGVAFTRGLLGFGLTFPNPKRALGAHGVPLWGSSAPAHHTHPLAIQPAGGAHASSSSIVARVLSADVSLARSRCACVVTGTAENTGNAHCTAVGSCHVKRSCRGSVWTTAASHSTTWSRTASVAMSLATS